MANELNSEQKKPLTEDDIKEEPASKGNNKTLKIVLIIVGVLVGLSLIGAALFGWIGARIGKSIIEQATNGSIDVDDGSFSFSDDDGDFELDTSQQLPQDFPEGIPLYEPSELISSSRIRQNDNIVWSASYTTSDEYSTVSSYYENVLDEGDWTLESIFEAGEFTNIGASNEAQGLNIQLNIINDTTDGNTGINLTVSKSQD